LGASRAERGCTPSRRFGHPSRCLPRDPSISSVWSCTSMTCVSKGMSIPASSSATLIASSTAA
jgi:hypothetical protein